MTEEYTQYDHLFKNVIPNAISGVQIFGMDDPYLKLQDYQNVNNLENGIWEDLFVNLELQLNLGRPVCKPRAPTESICLPRIFVGYANTAHPPGSISRV